VGTALCFSRRSGALGYLATALLIYSIWYGFARVNSPNFESSDIVDHCKNEGAPKPDAKPSAGDERRLTRVGFQKAILIVIWVLVPPIWFWLEYFGIWRYEDKDKRQCLEELKLGQELAAKIWLAAITALGILYFGKGIKGGGVVSCSVLDT
jgi:hypothetical protein